jgi:hypothetical protein
MYRDGKRFSGVRWVVMLTCVAGLSAGIQLLTPFSFVVVTLYMAATLVYIPMALNAVGAPLSLIRFDLVAIAWLKYVQWFSPQF